MHQVAYCHDALVPRPPTLLQGARHRRFGQRGRIQGSTSGARLESTTQEERFRSG